MNNNLIAVNRNIKRAKLRIPFKGKQNFDFYISTLLKKS